MSRRARRSPSRPGRRSGALRLGMDLAQRAGRSSAGTVSWRAARCAFDACARSAEPQLVTLVGVPGIGKCRLIFELFGARRARAGALQLAPGPQPALRRGRQLLGAGRDREDARGDSRERRCRELGGEAARRDRVAVRRRHRDRAGSSGTSARLSASRPSRSSRAAATRLSAPGAATSRRSPSSARSSWSSRTCTSPTKDCSTSSTTSSSGRAACRCSSSARPAPSSWAAGRAGEGARQTRRRLARAALRRRDGAARARAPRAAAARRRAPADADRARGGKPALRRGVRPLWSARGGSWRSYRRVSRGSSPPASTLFRRTRRS